MKSAITGLSAVALVFALCGCGSFRLGAGDEAFMDPADQHTFVELLDAAATLDRVSSFEDDLAMDMMLEDLFVLTTICSLKFTNENLDDVVVSTLYESPFDDFKILIMDESGQELALNTHTHSQQPNGRERRFELPYGTTFVRLVGLTPVSTGPVGDNLPYIQAEKLTKFVELKFRGGFPGSYLRGDIVSNSLRVEIIDRTALEPGRPAPRPGADSAPEAFCGDRPGPWAARRLLLAGKTAPAPSGGKAPAKPVPSLRI